jgi:hypothetical protein
MKTLILSKLWHLFFVLTLFFAIVTVNSAQEKPVALYYGDKVTPFYSKDFMISFVEPALKNLEAIIVAPDCPSMGWTNALSESAVLELILLLMKDYNQDELFPSREVKLLVHKQKTGGVEIKLMIVECVSHHSLDQKDLGRPIRGGP